MPRTQIILYRDTRGNIPSRSWLASLPGNVRAKCRVRIGRLAELGHELRRPEADLLRDKIYELRIGFQGINYRILYFFYGNAAVVLTHGIIKERIIPLLEIERAVEMRKEFESNPQAHTFYLEES